MDVSRSTYGNGCLAAPASARSSRTPMAQSPVLVDPQGGAIYQLRSSEGELFHVCFEGSCLFCDSLPAGEAHLRLMEQRLRQRLGRG